MIRFTEPPDFLQQLNGQSTLEDASPVAQLIKERARKPVIETAIAFAVTKGVNGELFYALEISEPWKPGGNHAQYVAILSKPEAMNIMGEWLKTMARQEVAERKHLENATRDK